MAKRKGTKEQKRFTKHYP